MTILTTFVGQRGDDFLIERSYLSDMYFTWWHMCARQFGRTMLVRETQGFGGYGVLMTFKPSFWNWNSSGWHIGDIFEDFYALPPGSSTPIPCPVITWEVRYTEQTNNFCLALSGAGGNDGITMGQAMPPGPSDWYAPQYPRLNITPWQNDYRDGGIFHPPIVC